MKNHGNLSEHVKPSFEVKTISSSAGTTSLNYDMKDYRQALVAVNVRGNYSTATVDLMESSASTVAGTSAAAGYGGVVVGGASTLIPAAGGVREMTVTITTASTAGDTLTFSEGSNSYTLTNANTTFTNVSTALYFGSTVGSTAATGLQLRMDSLKAALESTLVFGDSVICSTGTTASLTIAARECGSLGFQTTLAAYTAEVQQAVAVFDVNAEDMTTTANKRYLAAKISSISTAGQAGVTVIRTGGRYMPPTFAGKIAT